MQTIKRPALGKGLSALIPDAPEVPRASTTEADIDQLTPNDFQPRVVLDDARLEELAQSIRSNGVIQPIVVRRVGDRFQIIAGERRWRAAKRAGLLRVPVVVKDVSAGHERSLLEMALIENLQREDLNPLEAAAAYLRLKDEFHLTQEEVAKRVGKDRATVANAMRLLKLPASVREKIRAGELSAGHARALAALASADDQERLADEILRRALSVRQTEKRIAALASPARVKREHRRDPFTRDAEERLARRLGTRVRIVRRRRGGRIEIVFGSEEELIGLFERLTKGGA
jgi:ParB family chromosome partitioning protein